MTTWSKVILRGLAFGVPVAAGVIALALATSFKVTSETVPSQRQAPPVRVITLAKTDFLPRVRGYGAVTPAREWRAVARVEGIVAQTSPLLAKGEVVPAGTELLRLDDTEILLSLAQIDAQLSANRVREETLEASLTISRADAEIAQADLQRQEELLRQGTIPRTARDQAARQELAARAKLTEIENQIALNAAERAVLQAQRATAARNLDFTRITAPFDIRISDLHVDQGQFVARGNALFSGDGTEAAEVSAQFPMGELGPLVRALGEGGTVLDLEAEVHLTQPGHDLRWPASVMRAGDAIDARTQAGGVVVRVENPQAMAVPGQRPPLRRDMFVEVTLRAPLRPAIVVPDHAVQGGVARIVDAQGKLATRAVRIDFAMDGIAVIGDGLIEGDVLVVTDPAVAVPGMRVQPVEDQALAAQVAAVALGRDGAE